MDHPLTPEEKQALLQFMGTAYGASAKIDSGIVGGTPNLRPISHDLKNQFAQALNAPTAPRQVIATQPVPPPVESSLQPPLHTEPVVNGLYDTVSPEAGIVPIHMSTPALKLADQGVEVISTPVLDVLKQISNSLERIAVSLEAKNTHERSTKKTRNKEPA